VWDAHNISGFYAHCLGLNAAFFIAKSNANLHGLTQIIKFDSNNKV
jgi:hypothetical protein